MVPHEFLGIGWGEFMLLLVLAVIFFGPEKLPEISRKAARIVHAVRLFADQATSQLKQELGPEYQDLTIADLNPKTFVQKHLLADVQDDLDGIKKELDGVKTELTGSATDLKAARKQAGSVRNNGPGDPAPAAADDAAASTEGKALPSPPTDEPDPGEPGGLPAANPPRPTVPWDPEAT